jgi:hypothetical protein
MHWGKQAYIYGTLFNVIDCWDEIWLDPYLGSLHCDQSFQHMHMLTYQGSRVQHQTLLAVLITC